MDSALIKTARELNGALIVLLYSAFSRTEAIEFNYKRLSSNLRLKVTAGGMMLLKLYKKFLILGTFFTSLSEIQSSNKKHFKRSSEVRQSLKNMEIDQRKLPA
ncbi:hypothetical protein BST81_22795 [Leptolyngbya sp. 'hensonii']|uniref:hypothetical protein n=1 Tax=Leptolyngbya sp. 'hensonii' TaxID=1922337 RepID=UPI00094FE34B|nr:hypothetical protein [Leptolyngbya sp. 'hensonii']OLP16060.1 hypothetical protein BST81_22795 [Leptolyngbya sp. 'hensonii']